MDLACCPMPVYMHLSLPLRLIISGINHPTENIAEFAEKELEQHVRTLPSYIQDTTDFINKMNSIEQKLPGDSLLFPYTYVCTSIVHTQT
jgi:hypothetical protein